MSLPFVSARGAASKLSVRVRVKVRVRVRVKVRVRVRVRVVTTYCVREGRGLEAVG